MKYLTNKTAVLAILETGDLSILKKTDPSQRAELLKMLRHAQSKVIQKIENGPGSVRKSEPVQKSTWSAADIPVGQSFNDFFKSQERPSNKRAHDERFSEAEHHAYGQSMNQQFRKGQEIDMWTRKVISETPTEKTPRKGLPVAERGERRASKIISSDSIRVPKLNPNPEDKPVAKSEWDAAPDMRVGESFDSLFKRNGR